MAKRQAPGPAQEWSTSPARQGQGNRIHPTALFVDDVTLGDYNFIGPYVVLHGPLTIGDSNEIWQSTIGTPPEHREWRASGATTEGVRIGSGSVIREYSTIHAGVERSTSVDDGCYVMNHTYLGHDVHLNEQVTVASAATVGGHVTVGRNANIGLDAVVHQWRTIGEGCMVGMHATVTRDLPAYAKAWGSPARVMGVNRVLLNRLGRSPNEIDEIERGLVEEVADRE